MLEEIKKIRNYCKENNINLKIFITPDYYKMYEVYNKNDLKLFNEKLLEITDFYDFSGINHITINEKNYLNFDHFSAYIGDLIVKRIYFQKNFQDFGIYYPKKSRISNIQ